MTAEKILRILENQKFADWYGLDGRFDSYVRVDHPKGHPEHVSKENVLEDIKRIFSSVIPTQEGIREEFNRRFEEWRGDGDGSVNTD